MAEVLYNVAAGLILSLGSTAVNEIGLLWGVSHDLVKLRRTVGTIEAVILHAEEQSIHNPQIKHWLGLLNEALYDADDLMDEFSTEALRQQVMAGSNVSKKVFLFFSRSNQFVFGLKMGHKVRALRERLDEIAAEKSKFYLEERSGVGRSFLPKGRYHTHSSPPQVVIGREHDKEEIARVLLSADCDENVSVVSIVGIGGLGKTTLAQMVYDDANVKNHFEMKMWVCVSDAFDVHLLVKKTLESAIGENVNIAEMDPLKNLLHGKINGRKYLLVLDDVWNEDVHKWSGFKDLLAGGARGSKIVITTRLRTVAEMSRPISIHELRGLSASESWSLFKQVAFKQGQLTNPSLEATGKEIVAKCCGVPLAIKTIGGMLYFKDLESEWQLLKDKELSAIDVYKNDILPILKLSYNHLLPHYKHCFAYCSLYPKDSQIPVDELIQLWRAQGFVKPTDTNDCLQDAGFEYFMNLFRMSFFQDVKKDIFGNIKYCRMHDLMHDLAVSVAGNNFFASHPGETSTKNITPNVSSLLKGKKVRTLTMKFGYYTKKEEVDAVFCNLRCLRVLHLTHLGISTLPNSIYKLNHLRYLDLSYNHNIRRLPDSITNLHNLQVLKLEMCGNLVQLPSNITKLVNLTDLDILGCCKLSHMPKGIGKLTRLEKLPEYVIAKDHSSSKHIGGLDELHSLNNLKGELEIKNLRCLKNVTSEFMEARLGLKHKLEGLVLSWGKDGDENDNYSENDAANEEMGIEALCPHPNLKQLKVWNYGGVKPPSWLPSISHLVFASFWDCRNIRWLPPFDQLPHLKELKVYRLTKLERIRVGNGEGSSLFFHSLTHLSLFSCPNLEGFERLQSSSTKELPWFPCLSQLEIIGCPSLTYLPLFPEIQKFASSVNVIKSVMKIMKMATASSSFSTLSQLQSLHTWFLEHSMQKESNNCSTNDAANEEMVMEELCLEHSMQKESNNCSTNDAANEEMVMEELCPHPNLKDLFVSNYRGVKPPSWLPSITHLVSLSFWSCRSIQWLPSLDHLPYLKELEVNDLTKLERIHVVNGGVLSSFFPSLTVLTLRNCPNLMGFEKRLSSLSLEDLPCFPHLSGLSMKGCPNLTCLPLFPELRKLEIDGDGLKSLMQIMKMPKNSASQSTSTLSQLQLLEISNVEDCLEDELMQYLPSLQHLKFNKCSFRSVFRDEMGDGMQWQGLEVLCSVGFVEMRNLVGLPKGLQYATALQRMYLRDCPSLACIPEWMTKLVSLQDLTIINCQKLEERCKNHVAEDWPNMSLIPDVFINNKRIQRSDSYPRSHFGRWLRSNPQ